MNSQITTVVNIYRDPYDVYIGRAGKGQDGYFGNYAPAGTRDFQIAWFEKHFEKRIRTDPEYRSKILKLRGKRLGCFCSPKSCHGDVIANYLNNLSEDKPIRLAVVCSRDFNDYDFMKEILGWYTIRQILSTESTLLVRRLVGERNIPLKEFAADWSKYGKSAGYKRDELIADACDEMVAFMDKNHPTPDISHSIELVETKGKPVFIYWPENADPLLQWV